MNNLGFSNGMTPQADIIANAGLRVYSISIIGISSRIIKVNNFLNTDMARNMNEREWNDMHKDLIAGFSKFGKLADDFFVGAEEAGLGGII